MVRHNYNISSITTIPSIRTPLRYKLLLPKADKSITTIPRLYIYFRSIYQTVFPRL